MLIAAACTAEAGTIDWVRFRGRGGVHQSENFKATVLKKGSDRLTVACQKESWLQQEQNNSSHKCWHVLMSNE